MPRQLHASRRAAGALAILRQRDSARRRAEKNANLAALKINVFYLAFIPTLNHWVIPCFLVRPAGRGFPEASSALWGSLGAPFRISEGGMLLCTWRLPSFPPRHPPSRGSTNQNGTGVSCLQSILKLSSGMSRSERGGVDRSGGRHDRVFFLHRIQPGRLVSKCFFRVLAL